MAHFAQIDENNKVVQVLVVSDDQEHRGQEFLAEDLGLGGTWIKTSYNTYRGEHKTGGTPLRKNFAAIGMTYDPERDAFIPDKPVIITSVGEEQYEWNEEACNWDFVSVKLKPPIS